CYFLQWCKDMLKQSAKSPSVAVLHSEVSVAQGHHVEVGSEVPQGCPPSNQLNRSGQPREVSCFFKNNFE
ncbi:hypothetical protein CEXT_6761, partial [Caerostris extrusa]